MDYNVNITNRNNVNILQLDGNCTNLSSSIESHESESDLTDTSCSEESVQPSISFSSNEVTLNQTQEPSQISNLSDESLIEDNTSISVVMNIDFR